MPLLTQIEMGGCTLVLLALLPEHMIALQLLV